MAESLPRQFEAIVRDYPNDPIVPHALLYAGMSAIRAGDVERALGSLDKVVTDPESAPRICVVAQHCFAAWRCRRWASIKRRWSR